MNKLTKEKRDQLILVALATIGVSAGLWFGLISMQKNKLRDLSRKMENTQQEISKVDKVARETGQVEADLKVASAQLQEIESGMPAGDAYAWVNSMLRGFNRPGYHVDIPSIGPPMPGEMVMLPDFPYHQIMVSLGGTAFWSDLGRFTADFENRFPYMRIQISSLEPGGSPILEEREKLNFRLEIIALTKINSP